MQATEACSIQGTSPSSETRWRVGHNVGSSTRRARIESFATVVGPERVIASTDCGFGTFVLTQASGRLACAKLTALADRAELASKRLFLQHLVTAASSEGHGSGWSERHL